MLSRWFLRLPGHRQGPAKAWHPSESMAPRHLLGVAGVLIIGLSAGCSGRPSLAEVKGQVTMNGKPIGNVKVDFHPDPDKGTTGKGSSGTTDNEGNFALSYENSQPGAIVGHHRVILTDLDIFGNVLVGRGDYRKEENGKAVEAAKKPRFAGIYSNLAQTPFREEVKPGMGPVNIDLKPGSGGLRPGRQ
jgi:hypothetical protein